MNKKEFCNYGERATGARKGIRAKNKKNIVRNFCFAFPERYNYNTWHGRTVARNCLVVGAKKYNLGTLKYKVSKGNGVSKKRRPITDLDPSDQLIYQEIVEDIMKHHNISKDEIEKRIREKKKNIKNKKSMCETFNVNRRNIYREPSGSKPKEKIQDFEIQKVYKIGEENFKVYGYRKCSKVASLSEGKTRRIYQLIGISSLRQAKLRKPKEIKISKEMFPNIVNRNFNPTKPNLYGHTDVSYIKIGKSGMYFSAVIDSYNNKLLDGKLSNRHDTNLVLNNIKDAIKKYGIPQVIHSDHGYEYKSHRYLEFCKSKNIKISMSRIGNSLDNRPIEFFFGQLKRESLRIHKYYSIAQLDNQIDEYVKGYNLKRIQENLNGLSPAKFAG